MRIDKRKNPIIRHLIESTVDNIGEGYYGQAFLLPDGSVMKVADKRDGSFLWVEWVFYLGKKLPDDKSKHYPDITRVITEGNLYAAFMPYYKACPKKESLEIQDNKEEYLSPFEDYLATIGVERPLSSSGYEVKRPKGTSYTRIAACNDEELRRDLHSNNIRWDEEKECAIILDPIAGANPLRYAATTLFPIVQRGKTGLPTPSRRLFA